MEGRFQRLFVIPASRKNAFRPIQLLQYHHPAEMMGERHGTDAQLEISLGFQTAVDAKGGAHQEHQLGFSAQSYLIQLLRQLLGG